MAGLIDVGIVKPELAGAFGAGYRSSQLGREQLAQEQQQTKLNQIKMQQLEQDRAMMLELQQKLKAAGQDPDLDKVFDALIATGNPDYVMKGMEGKQRLKDQREYARITGGFGAPAAPGAARPLPAPGALGSGTFEIPLTGATLGTAPIIAAPPSELVARPIGPPQGTERDIPPMGQPGPERRLGTPAPANALAPAAAAPAAPVNLMAPKPVTAGPGPAPVNALAAPAPGAAATPNAALITQTQNRINELLSFAGRTQSPQMATNALAQAKVLQDQLELYSKPGRNEPAALQELRAYMAMSPEEKAAFEKLQKIKTPSTNVAVNTATGKSLAGPVGGRAEASLVKAEGASGIMENANMVREALNSGNVIAGPLAGPRLKFAQILELAGAGDKQKLVNTRNAIQGLAAMTLESRAELKGQGQVTENEQKLLERARSGNIEDMTVAELQQIVNVSQRLANRLWSNHQTLLKTMETDPAAADAIRYYRPTVTLPQALGEGKPSTPAETDKRKQGLDAIFGGKR